MSMLVRGFAAAGLVVAAVAATAAPANAALVNGCVYGDKHVVVELLNKELVEVCYNI